MKNFKNQNYAKQWYEYWWVWVFIVIFFLALLNPSKDSGNDSACSDEDIVNTQRSLGVSRERAIEICKSAEKYADSVNNSGR